jgi:hypothetical protein
MSGIAPWWLGVHSYTARHYETHSEPIALTRDGLANHPEPYLNLVSVIVSDKSRTPFQQQRLKLVDYLASKIPEIQVFGVGSKPVADKADVLSQFRYHIAVENSAHEGYWTEKLSDPVLMRDFVFYGGHESFRADVTAPGVSLIDPYNLEGSYRLLCDSLSRDDWTRTAEGRFKNRETVLTAASFHRNIEKALLNITLKPVGASIISIPAQHPVSHWKRLVDPIYQRLRNP